MFSLGSCSFRKLNEKHTDPNYLISVRFTFSQKMEPETSAEETLEVEVRHNESFYIITPHSDPELAQCHGFNLKKDFEVRYNLIDLISCMSQNLVPFTNMYNKTCFYL